MGPNNSIPNSKIDPTIIPLSVTNAICLARYLQADVPRAKHKIHIYESPVGMMQAPIYAELIFAPGLEFGIKKDSIIYVFASFTFDHREGRIVDFAPNAKTYILGMANIPSLLTTRVGHPASKDTGDFNYIHPNMGHGIVCKKSGHTLITTQGSVKTIMKAGGNGVDQDLHQTYAQNFLRVIANSPPFYPAREYFGMFIGNDLESKAAASNPKNRHICYRRFVPSNQLPEDWVSTCEGAWNPWVGPNVDDEKLEGSKDILFSKVVNKGSKRLTIDAGDPGDGFFNLRVDSVTLGEKSIGSRTTPAILSNKMKLRIADSGAIELSVGGKGVAPVGMHNCIITIEPSGDVKISTKGSVEIDADKSIDLKSKEVNIDASDSFTVTSKAIELKGASSIDLKSKATVVAGGGGKIDLSGGKCTVDAGAGLTVNGKALVHEEFLNWMTENASMFTMTTGLGAPAPLHPAGLAKLNAKVGVPGGMKTTGAAAPPAPPIIILPSLPKLHIDTDIYTSV
jgi:hypothetical protein